MIPRPLFITSGPHLSGYRVQLGYETLAEAQAAHDAIARQQAATPDASPVGIGPLADEQKHQAVSAEDVAAIARVTARAESLARIGADQDSADLRRLLALLPTPTKGNDAGVVGDLVEALRLLQSIVSETEFPPLLNGRALHALGRSEAALAKYATQQAGPSLDQLPQNFELSYGYEDPYEGDGGCWRVHRVNGGVNDREWTLVAQASTPSAAIRKALASHQPAISTDRSGT